MTADTHAHGADSGCNRKTISMVVSPNNAWVALLQEDLCSDGAFTTSETDTVQIVQYGEIPSPSNNVFSVDEGGHSENRPAMRWISSQELQINVPNKSLIGLQKSSYEGIDIVIKYEPDNPAEREQFLKSLGLTPK